MKYTRKYKRKDGSTAVIFVPPEDVRQAEVLRSQSFRDGKAARYAIPRLIQIVEDYRAGKIKTGKVGPDSKVKEVITHYLASKEYASLANSSQIRYEQNLTKIRASKLGEIPLSKLTAQDCKEAYDQWASDVSVQTANERSRIFSVVLNYAKSLDLTTDNPMSRVKKLKHEPYTPIWTRGQVESFLEKAFTKFEWRNVGLLVLMCYEWAQRPKDICLLTWDRVDLDRARVQIKQTKRGAEVKLPIDEPLLSMLKQQREDWGFQKYVIPYHRSSDNAYVPLKPETFGPILRDIKGECGLPDDLKIGHLRKTAITEFVAAGVDSTGIMQVTGHKNLTSLNPYMKHTYEGAKSALGSRKEYKDG